MISEDQLRLAAQDARNALADSLPDPENCHHDFSPVFEKKMRRLIRKHEYAGFYQGLKRAACFFLAILLSGGAWLGVDAEARYIVFGWISEKLEDAQHYFHQGTEISSKNIVHYEITVPEGYWLEDRYTSENLVDEYYVNSDGSYVSFSYLYDTNTSEADVYIIDADTEKKRVFINDMAADLYLSTSTEKSNTLVWTDTYTGALIDVTALLNENDLIKLAESVERKEK